MSKCFSKKVRKYEEGYARKPDSLEEIKALEQLAAEAFWKEGYARWLRRKYGKSMAR